MRKKKSHNDLIKADGMDVSHEVLHDLGCLQIKYS